MRTSSGETGVTGGPPSEPPASQSAQTFDDQSRLARVAKPEGTIDYGYDNAGSLSSMSYLGRTLLYEHDFFGRLKSAEAPEGDWEYRYNDAGHKVRVTNRKNDSHEERTYDALGRLLSVSHVNDATGAVVFQID